jgi:ribosomal protein S18 acetylase RimI-like enzyme
MNIRQMQAEDIPALLALWRQAGLAIRPKGRDTTEALARQFESMGRHWWMAEQDGKVIGAVMGTHDARKGWINRIAVHPDYRRRGVASALADRVEQSLAEDGMEIFAALIEDDNETSCRLFEALGYEKYPVHYYRKKLHEDV